MSETEKQSTNDSLFDSNFSDQDSPAADVSAPVQDPTDSDSAPSTAAASADPSNENADPVLSEEELGKTELTIRSLVSSKQAGIIIGKDGKNVADLREQTGVKAGVSKSIAGVPDRILTVTGTLDGIAHAYSMAANTLLSTPVSNPQVTNFHSPPQQGVSTIKLLISHHQMGTIIGLQGAKIKSIQESTKVRMVASKELLPNSTERTVEVQGTPDAIRAAVWEIGRCLLEDPNRATSTIYYNPQARPNMNTNNNLGPAGGPGPAQNNNGFGNNSHGNSYPPNNRFNPANPNATNPGNGLRNGGSYNRHNSYSNNNYNNGFNGAARNREPEGDIVTDEMPISVDMVGCIIGRGGSRIADIRRESGAKISIAKEAHDSSGERMFTITGTKEANQKALSLLFNQLEYEKKRRTAEDNDDDKQDA